MYEFDLSAEQERREKEQDEQAEDWAMDLAELAVMFRRWGGRQLMRGIAQVYAEVFTDGSKLSWRILSSAYLSMHGSYERDPISGTTDEF